MSRYKNIKDSGFRLRKKISIYAKRVLYGGETLPFLSYKYLGDSRYWWIIAEVNNINDPFDKDTYPEYLIIPAKNEIHSYE